jgi:hypothetical protein
MSYPNALVILLTFATGVVSGVLFIVAIVRTLFAVPGVRTGFLENCKRHWPEAWDELARHGPLAENARHKPLADILCFDPKCEAPSHDHALRDELGTADPLDATFPVCVKGRLCACLLSDTNCQNRKP